MKHLLLVIILAWSSSAFAVKSAIPKTEMSRKGWKNQIHKFIVSEACHKEGFFMSCYGVKQGECHQYVRKASKSCFKRMKIPRKVSSINNGPNLAIKHADCVGKNFLKKFNRNKLGNKQCLERQRSWR